MKILLTGTSGQVGHALSKLLAGHHQLITPDRQQLDLAQPDSIAAYVREIQPDLIINPAAYTAVDKAESEPELAQAINAAAPAALATAAKELGIGLIHYSTDYVYRGDKQDAAGQRVAYLESDPTGPQNVYGASKLAGEQAIQDSGCQYLIFRTSWVYSQFGKNFLLTMLRLAGERDQLRVVNDQWGAPTSADSIAEATASIIEQFCGLDHAAQDNWWRDNAGIYHLTNRGQTSWCGFTEAIMQEAAKAGRLSKAAPEVTGIPASEYPTPARRPSNSCLEVSKLERQFGIRLPDWQQALQSCLGTAV